jgi:hypothetical protein
MSQTNTKRYNTNMTTRTNSKLLNYESSMPSRTLLVRESETKLPTLKGLMNEKAYTKTGNAFFLTFDTLPNAISAYNSLTTLAFNAKYSYYRVFFTLSYADNSLFPNDKFNHEELKKELTELVSKHGNILFYKQYKKDNKFLNCGYFTVDKIDTLNTLLNKESGLKDFTLSNNVKGTFYKFNNKNYQTNNFANNVATA